MPAPEHPEQAHHPEQVRDLYLHVRHYHQEQMAAAVYHAVQDVLLATPCDLSVYRFLLTAQSHVLVIGRTPPPELDQELSTLLATGIPVNLPEEVRQAFLARRRAATTIGLWVEGQYQPGVPLTDRRQP